MVNLPPHDVERDAATFAAWHGPPRALTAWLRREGWTEQVTSRYVDTPRRALLT